MYIYNLICMCAPQARSSTASIRCNICIYCTYLYVLYTQIHVYICYLICVCTPQARSSTAFIRWNICICYPYICICYTYMLYMFIYIIYTYIILFYYRICMCAPQARSSTASVRCNICMYHTYSYTLYTQIHVNIYYLVCMCAPQA